MGAGPMRAHDQFVEDLALYSLGALEGTEKRVLEQHLDDCSCCRSELRQLQRDVAFLVRALMGPLPSRLTRDRLLQRIGGEDHNEV